MPLTIDDVRAAIAARKLRWVADEDSARELLPGGGLPSPMFGLALSEAQKKSELNKAKYTDRAAIPKAPPSIDWRDKDGHNWLSDIKHQGPHQTCVAFATLAAIEARVRVKRHFAPLEIDLSEAQIFQCGGGDLNVGWKPEDALKFMKERGAARESDAPIDQIESVDCTISFDPLYKIADYKFRATANQRKWAIAKNGPVIAGMNVHEDFVYYKSGIYEPTTATIRDPHAVAVVGYNDDKEYWIIQSSWGKNWGEDGFAKIAYGACELDSKYVFYEPEVT